MSNELEDRVAKLEKLVKNLVGEKNKQDTRLTKIENNKTLQLENLKIGDKIVITSHANHAGIWIKQEDGNWYKVNK